MSMRGAAGAPSVPSAADATAGVECERARCSGGARDVELTGSSRISGNRNVCLVSGLDSSEPSWSKEAMGAGPRRSWRTGAPPAAMRPLGERPPHHRARSALRAVTSRAHILHAHTRTHTHTHTSLLLCYNETEPRRHLTEAITAHSLYTSHANHADTAPHQ